MRESNNETLPAWADDLLKSPVMSSEQSRQRIMQLVRLQPFPRALRPPLLQGRWTRRGLITPVGSALVTCLLAVMLSLRVSSPGVLGGSFDVSSRVIGDSVVPRTVQSTGNMLSETIFDTLRVVEFVVRGKDIRSAQLVGDFKTSGGSSAGLRAQAANEWRTRVLVPRDALRFAIMVNNQQLIPAQPLPPAAAASLHDSI